MQEKEAQLKWGNTIFSSFWTLWEKKTKKENRGNKHTHHVQKISKMCPLPQAEAGALLSKLKEFECL